MSLCLYVSRIMQVAGIQEWSGLALVRKYRQEQLMIARLIVTVLWLASLPWAPAQAQQQLSEWGKSHRSKARLLVGAMPHADGRTLVYAGVEIKLADGWKTYWRHPGDAGGIPPYFDWSKSDNIARTEVLFPAPVRFRDSVGDAIGYKKHVILPVLITPRNTARAVSLALNLEYGVCRDICIPAQAKLALRVRAAQLHRMPSQLATALQQVPRRGRLGDSVLPRLSSVTAALQSVRPAIVLDAMFPAGSQTNDLFVEAGREIYLPITSKLGAPAPGIVRFKVDLSNGIDLKRLTGARLRITMVADSGSREVEYQLP